MQHFTSYDFKIYFRLSKLKKNISGNSCAYFTAFTDRPRPDCTHLANQESLKDVLSLFSCWYGHCAQMSKMSVLLDVFNKYFINDTVCFLDETHICLSASLGGDTDYINRKFFPS